MSPEDTDGPPEVMPSNDWWKFGSQALDSVTKVALARAMQPAADSGYVSSNAKNPPPGGGGLYPQSAATGGASVIPGGAPRGARMTADGDVPALGGAASADQARQRARGGAVSPARRRDLPGPRFDRPHPGTAQSDLRGFVSDGRGRRHRRAAVRGFFRHLGGSAGPRGECVVRLFGALQDLAVGQYAARGRLRPQPSRENVHLRSRGPSTTRIHTTLDIHSTRLQAFNARIFTGLPPTTNSSSPRRPV